MMHHTQHMASALRYARRGVYTTAPNPKVGCVLVKDGKEIAAGWHMKAGEAHAEIMALNRAGDEAKDATAYVTLEPCSHIGKTGPCADALIQSGVKQVYIAMKDPNPLVAGQGIQKLEDAGIDVNVGLLEARARALNEGFIKRMEKGRPFVRVKMAMSLDGKTAMASGESQWVTCEEARTDVQELRARSSAILTGISTVIADDPSLNVRLPVEKVGYRGEIRQPLRVVLDTHGKMPANAKMLDLPGQTLVITADASKIASQPALIVEEVGLENDHLDLEQVMKVLANHDVNDVHVEAGSTLCGNLIAKNLADEIIIYMASNLMGDDAQGLFKLPEIQSMQQRIDLNIDDVRAVGKDWRISARPVLKTVA